MRTREEDWHTDLHSGVNLPLVFVNKLRRTQNKGADGKIILDAVPYLAIDSLSL